MPRKKKDKYVSNFVTIEDVCSRGVTAIWSGVGSGKNGFIEGVHKKIIHDDGRVEEINVVGLAERYRVLLITSRKAKVTETEARHRKDFYPYLTDVRHIDDFNYVENDNNSFVCTSAHIKDRIKQDYSPTILAPEPFWKKFDFVVVDEFHSLIADATFSETAFIMKCFIDKIYEDCIKGRAIKDIKPKLIFMSGTPRTTKKLLENFEYKAYDLFNDAKYVKPKKLTFSYRKKVISEIQSTLKKGGTVVYYMCVLEKLRELIRMAKDAGVSENRIAVSVADEDTIKWIKENYKNTIYENIKLVEDSLSAEMKIPQGIQFFITNSKNKEGINIETKPDLLVIEHHYEDDIIQICGRFRNGVKNVKVIDDAQQFHLPVNYEREEEYQREEGILAVNNYLQKLIDRQDIDLETITAYYQEDLKNFISYIEKSTRYIRFNPFENIFEINECYAQARNDYEAGVNEFKALMKRYEMGKSIILDNDFYRGIQVEYTPRSEPIDLLEKCFTLNGWELGVTVFTEREGKKLFKDLLKIYNAQPKTKENKFKYLGNLVKYFGCQKIQYGKAENNQFQIVRLSNRENN